MQGPQSTPSGSGSRSSFLPLPQKRKHSSQGLPGALPAPTPLPPGKVDSFVLFIQVQELSEALMFS